MRHVFAFLLCMLAGAGHADPVRVLLVGVTDYAPEVTELAPALNGPGNDVALMLDVFRQSGIADDSISVLTDRADALPEDWAGGAKRPTRAAILGHLDDLARSAVSGSEIAIFLAGHGAQVPAADPGSEADGLDEVFLPVDFELRGRKDFGNLIRDDEIGARIDAMLERGAHVWLIADTCHSGSLRRSDGADAVPRYVDLSFGTVHPPSASEPIIDLSEPARLGRAPGSFVGFFAAKAGSLAFETRRPGTDEAHGLLTMSLATGLRKGTAKTYRALARDISAHLWQVGRGRAEPEFSGSLATEHMLASVGATDETFALRISDRIEIAAGRLDGLLPGTEVTVRSKEGDPLFIANLTEVGLTRAFAPLPEGPAPGLDAVLRAEDLDPQMFRQRWLADRAPNLVAEVTHRPFDTALTVAIAPSDLSADFSARLRATVDAMVPAVRIVERGAHVWLEAEDDRLFLRPAPPGAAAALSVAAEPEALPELEAMLRRSAKARALADVATAMAASDITRVIDVYLEVTGGQVGPDGACVESGNARRGFAPDALRPPVIGHCDRVTLHVQNSGDVALDITPLYLAPDHQVFFLSGYDDALNGGWRILPGLSDTLTYTEATQAPDGRPLATGPMHLLLLAVEAEEHSAPVDFRHLQDLAPPPQRRSSGENALETLLNAAGFGLALTRSIGQHELGRGGAVLVSIETVTDERLAEIER